MERVKRPELLENFVGSLRFLLQGRHAESIAATEFCVRNFQDPEAVFYMARQLVRLGETERALEVLADVLRAGLSVFVRVDQRPVARSTSIDAGG